jgi:hypothetical protein
MHFLILKLFATICNYLQLFATICNYLQLFATICNYLQLFGTISFYKCIEVQHDASQVTLCLFWWLPLIRTKSNSRTSDREIPRKYYLQSSALFVASQKGRKWRTIISSATKRLKWHPSFGLDLSWREPADILIVPRWPNTRWGQGALGSDMTAQLWDSWPNNQEIRGFGWFWSSDKPSHYEWVVSVAQAQGLRFWWNLVALLVTPSYSYHRKVPNSHSCRTAAPPSTSQIRVF